MMVEPPASFPESPLDVPNLQAAAAVEGYRLQLAAMQCPMHADPDHAAPPARP